MRLKNKFWFKKTVIFFPYSCIIISSNNCGCAIGKQKNTITHDTTTVDNNNTKNINSSTESTNDSNIQIVLKSITVPIGNEQNINLKVIQGDLLGHHVKTILIKKEEDGNDYSKNFGIERYHKKSLEELLKKFSCKPSEHLQLGDYTLTLTLEKQNQGSITTSSCNITVISNSNKKSTSNSDIEEDAAIANLLTLQLKNTLLILNQETSFVFKFSYNESLASEYILKDVTLEEVEKLKEKTILKTERKITNVSVKNNNTALEEQWGLSKHIGSPLTGSFNFKPTTKGVFKFLVTVGKKGTDDSRVIKKCEINVIVNDTKVEKTTKLTISCGKKITVDIGSIAIIPFTCKNASSIAPSHYANYYIHDISIKGKTEKSVSTDQFGMEVYKNKSIEEIKNNEFRISPNEEILPDTYRLSITLGHKQDTSFVQNIRDINIIVRSPLELCMPEYTVLDKNSITSITISTKEKADYTDYIIKEITVEKFKTSQEVDTSINYIDELGLRQLNRSQLKQKTQLRLKPERGGKYFLKVRVNKRDNKNNEPDKICQCTVVVFDFDIKGKVDYEYVHNQWKRLYKLKINELAQEFLDQQGYVIKEVSYYPKDRNKKIPTFADEIQSYYEKNNKIPKEIKIILDETDIGSDSDKQGKNNITTYDITLTIEKEGMQNSKHIATYELIVKNY